MERLGAGNGVSAATALSTSASMHRASVTSARTLTELIYNDLATGEQERETLAVFIEKSQQLASGLNSAFGGYAPTILSL